MSWYFVYSNLKTSSQVELQQKIGLIVREERIKYGEIIEEACSIGNLSDNDLDQWLLDNEFFRKE